MALTEDAQNAIKEEEEIVDTIVDSLNEQLHASSTKLLKESKRARQLTSELVAATRDEDKQMLASDEAVSHAVTHLKAGDIKALEKLLEVPYFARFVLDESEANGKRRTSEYRLGFCANPDCRIIDWRKAPISKLYYEYKEGDDFSEEIQGIEREGRVSLRNSVEIKNGVLNKLGCRYGQFVREKGEWAQIGGQLRSRATGSATYGELPQILPLITAEQFDLITSDSDTSVLIQGIAGSGKTTVALHRLAWLLHEDNSSVTTEDCLVLVLHKALQVYTDRTLPSMGIEGVRVLTFSEWSADFLKQILPPAFLDENGKPFRPERKPSRSIGRVFRSMALFQVLEQGEQKLLSRTIERVASELPWIALPPGLKSLFDSEKEKAKSALQLLDALQAGIQRGLGSLAPTHPALAHLKEASSSLIAIASDCGYIETVRRALTEEAAILEFDESHLLTAAIIREAALRFESCLQEQSIDESMDALFVRLALFRNRTPFRKDGARRFYKHIVADEIQEFSPGELACVLGSVEHLKDVTLVGDVAQQTRDSHSFPGWDRLMKHWGFRSQDSRYVSLTVSHRSTLPIMQFADEIQRRKSVTDGRPGRKPIWFASRSESKGIESAIAWLQKAIERYPNAITAVLCASEKEARHVHSLLTPTFGAAVRLGDNYTFSFDEGIIVTNISQVKGLEFLNVLIWNPAARYYPDKPAARNALYIAVTRAEENVCLVTWGPPSPLLPSLYSPFVRGINLDADEEESKQTGTGQR